MLSFLQDNIYSVIDFPDAPSASQYTASDPNHLCSSRGV